MSTKTFTLLTVLLTMAAVVRAEDAVTTAPPATVTSSLAPSASTNEPTIITSEHLQIDYINNVGTFTGNVLAIDPRITVRGDKMTVFFSSTNVVTSVGENTTRSVQKIITEGAVVITQEEKKSNSDRAEYTTEDGKVVLTGNPRVESPDGVVTGLRITFWRGSQIMDVDAGPTQTNRTRLVIYPEDQRKKK